MVKPQGLAPDPAVAGGGVTDTGAQWAVEGANLKLET
jgi:hypothetical protein